MLEKLEKIYVKIRRPDTCFILNESNYGIMFSYLKPRIRNGFIWSIQEIEHMVRRGGRAFCINGKRELTSGNLAYYQSKCFKVIDVERELSKVDEIEAEWELIEEDIIEESVKESIVENIVEEINGEDPKEEKKEVEKREMAKKEKDVIKESLEQKIIESILPDVKKEVMKNCKDLVKNITTVVVTLDDEVVKQCTTSTHHKFKDLLTLVNNNIPAMLTGGAGSGKSSTCEKVAEVLGLDFYFSNAITQEYKLTGFIDANGKYQETQFYKAFKNGGLFVLDEIDASVPEALVILNTAIANGYFDFPNGKVEAHKNFRIVACANTYGLGGNDVYVGRNQLDGASLDRFAVVYFDYDKVLEKGLVEDQQWVEFIQNLRDRIRERKIKHIVSMRASIYGDKLIKAGLEIREIFRQIIFKNLQIDDIKTIGTLGNVENRYVDEFNKIINEK